MQQLRLVGTPSSQIQWRETDFAEDIPPLALKALAAYYPLVRSGDLDAIARKISSAPCLSGPHNALYRISDGAPTLVRQGDEICDRMSLAIADIIEEDILGTQDGARRYEILVDEFRDATLLPMLQNAGLCLAVVV